MRRYRIAENGLIPHFVTWTLAEWLPLFLSDSYCSIITGSLDYCRREKGLLVHAYVIMPTHLHGILSVSGGYVLSDVLRDARKYTSKAIVGKLEEDGHRLFEWVFRDAARKAGRPGVTHKVWSDDTHPVAIESERFLLQRIEYLHNNPVRKGLVELPEHWRYSSAALYVAGRKGPLEIDALEW